MDISDLLEYTIIRRTVATFLRPGDWDTAAPSSRHFSSIAKVHNTGYYFPGKIPDASYIFPAPKAN